MKELSIAVLNKLKPTQVIKDEGVKERFIKMHKSVHGCDEKESETFYDVVSEQMIPKIIDDNYIMEASGYSVYNCMLDIASWGLPITAGSDTLVYIVGGNVKKGDQWIRVMTVDQTVNGKEASSIRAGQLLRSSDVTLVREGEKCEIYIDDKGNKTIEHRGNPLSAGKIVGGYIRFTFPDKSFEYIFYPYSEIDRLMEYSVKKNRGKANELYTKGTNGQADEGFVKTKFKKLALKTLPQLCMSQYSLVASADYTEGYESRFGAGLDPDLLDTQATAETPKETKPEPKTNGLAYATVEDEDDIF